MTDPDYIELRAHSAYSLLRGTSPPEALAAEAARLGLRGPGADRPQQCLRAR